MSTPPEGRRSRGSGRHQRIRGGATSAPRGERYRDATLRQDHYGRAEARNTRGSGGVPRQSGIETATGGLPPAAAAAQRSQESPSDRRASDAVQTSGGSPDFAAGGVSAEYFAEISRLADTTGTGVVGDIQSEIRRGSAAAGTGVSPEVQEASETEQRHEIIALGESRLVLNLGNWRRFRETAIRERDRQTLVVSCLGDTSAGKSHTILSLLGTGEEGPYCPPSGAAQGATTFNVNLYQSRTYHPKVTVNFVDYEGENGSDTPSMAAVRSLHNAGPSNVARHTAVRDYFPTLAYTTSDVVIVISREPFTNRQYLSRCVELSKRANRGVQNVDRPALVLVGNKVPGQECHFKVEKSTLQFFRTWGKQAAKLDEFFSAVFCFYLPHRGSSWMEPASLAEANGTTGAEAPTMPGAPRQVSGEKMFRRQLRKVRAVLEGFARERFSKSSGDVVRSGLGSLDGSGDPSGAKTPAEVLGKLGGGELGGSAGPSDLDGGDDRESGLSATSGAGGSVGDASSEGGSSVKSEAAARRERELASMHRPRLLTQQSTLWYSLLPAVLRELNNGRGVDVTRLIDQAWARQLVTVKAGDENDVDAIHALNTFVAPDPSLSDASQFPELERLWRYRARRAMMLDVAVRLAACRLRWLDPSVLVPEKTTRFAERLLRKSRELLDSLAPCCALYDTEGASTTASERPGEPVLCLQERRSHSVHRTCRTVTGGRGIFGLPNFYFIPYNDTWTGEFKAPTDDALDRLERKFRSGTRGKALVAPKPTLLGTRAGEEAEEEAVARGDMTELTSAVDVLLAGSGGDSAAGGVGDGDGDGGVTRGTDAAAGDRDPGIGSAVPFSSSSPSISSSAASSSHQAGSGSGAVAPAVPLGRRTSREPSVRSQVKEVLALVRLSDREFLEELLRFQERHTTALACVGFVPIRRGRRRDIERGAVPGLREGSMGDGGVGEEEEDDDSSDSDSDSESDSGSEMGAGGSAGDDDVGDSRGPCSDGLLRPCDPVQDKVHARLRLLSTLPASIWVPYCLGCGVKVEGRGASGSRAESGGDGLGDLGEDVGGSGTGGGLMGGISDLFSWMVGAGAGGSGEGGAGSEGASMSMQRQMKSLSLGASGSGAGSGWSDGAGVGSGDAEDMAMALSSSEGPSAVGGLGLGAGSGQESGLGSGSGSSSVDGSPLRGSGSPGRAGSGPTRQNVWLGLCKRCWRASYLEPVYREAARRRGRGAPADGDGSGADCLGSEGGRFD